MPRKRILIVVMKRPSGVMAYSGYTLRIQRRRSFRSIVIRRFNPFTRSDNKSYYYYCRYKQRRIPRRSDTIPRAVFLFPRSRPISRYRIVSLVIFRDRFRPCPFHRRSCDTHTTHTTHHRIPNRQIRKQLVYKHVVRNTIDSSFRTPMAFFVVKYSRFVAVSNSSLPPRAICRVVLSYIITHRPRSGVVLLLLLLRLNNARKTATFLALQTIYILIPNKIRPSFRIIYSFRALLYSRIRNYVYLSIRYKFSGTVLKKFLRISIYIYIYVWTFSLNRILLKTS